MLHKPKPKWDKAEVCAVEKHLMRFIEEHKLPQKDNCTRCLEAEPCALKNRSWRGIKDYVRNRITALQRQSGSSKAPSKTKSQPRKGTSQSSGNNLTGNFHLSKKTNVALLNELLILVNTKNFISFLFFYQGDYNLLVEKNLHQSIGMHSPVAALVHQISSYHKLTQQQQAAA